MLKHLRSLSTKADDIQRMDKALKGLEDFKAAQDKIISALESLAIASKERSALGDRMSLRS